MAWKSRKVTTLGELETAIRQLRKSLPRSTPLAFQRWHSGSGGFQGSISQNRAAHVQVGTWEDDDRTVYTPDAEELQGRRRRKDFSRLERPALILWVGD